VCVVTDQPGCVVEVGQRYPLGQRNVGAMQPCELIFAFNSFYHRYTGYTGRDGPRRVPIIQFVPTYLSSPTSLHLRITLWVRVIDVDNLRAYVTPMV